MDENRVRLIRLVVTRIPLSSGQIALFKALNEIGDHWISKSELAHRMQVNDESSVTGILGALGNRINQTEGVVPPIDGIGLLMTWETFHDEWHYRMLPELRSVIDGFPVLQNALNLSVDEIYQLYGDGLVI
jgi:hypothetical protein